MPGPPPPGRAGRVWLAGRLDVACRATALLEHKQQLLRREQVRLAALSEQTHRDWHDLASEADIRWARVMVAGRGDDVRRATARLGNAHARLSWTTQAGVTYPATAATELPPTPPLGGDVAIIDAVAVCRRALEAAVQDAACATALTRVTTELAATTRRLRAIRDRWLPSLQNALADVDLRLDETDREEVTRLRWTQHRRPDRSNSGA